MSDSMDDSMPRRYFVRRIACASLLHADTYEEVEADRSAIWQATLIVSAASVSIGAGSFSNGGAAGIAWTAGVMFMSWILWACVSCAIGVGLLATPETESDPGELLRTIGFSASPARHSRPDSGRESVGVDRHRLLDDGNARCGDPTGAGLLLDMACDSRVRAGVSARGDPADWGVVDDGPMACMKLNVHALRFRRNRTERTE